MNVSVGKDLEEYAKGKVASGDYATVSEVVRDGLRLLKERDRLFDARLQALRGAIDLGIAEAERGELLDGPQAMAELRSLVRDRTR